MSNPVTLARIVPPVDSYPESEHDSRIMWHSRHARRDATRRRAARLASDLTAERATSARLADRCLDLGRELEALRALATPPTWIADRFCRLGAFGLGIGPEGTGSAGRAFLFFWAAGPASTCHWFASYRSIEHAREQAPEDARAIIGPASGCECTFAGPCTEHASERADDFLQVRS